MTIPDIVRTILEQEHITRSELARRLGISKQAVGNMLSRDDMMLSSVVKVLHAVGYDFIIEKRRNSK